MKLFDLSLFTHTHPKKYYKQKVNITNRFYKGKTIPLKIIKKFNIFIKVKLGATYLLQ